jgi:hypothetical protein
MKTTLSMNKPEFLSLLKKMVPSEFLPKGNFTVDFEQKGYPEKEYVISIEEVTND